MDKVFIKNLRVRTIIGIRDWERKRPQDILINITVHTDTRSAAASDDIQDCVDYSVLAKEVRALVVAARSFTVEALSEEIAQFCLSKLRVQKVTVKVEKPGAVKGAKSVGVEIERP